jgi:hypothetical protein
VSSRKIQRLGKDAQPEELPTTALMKILEERQHEPWVPYVRALIWENNRMMAALSSIDEHEGKVCLNFESCNHKGCNSSYAAWSIANEAVKDIMEFKHTH